MLHGYGWVIALGTWQTVKLALLSLLLAVVLGLLGASAKVSRVAALNKVASVYTTLIRGVPDLVLMLLLFYSIQMWLNRMTDYMQIDQVDIDPFVAGVMTIGFIYGAYFTETFRGAFMSVPAGQIEAGVSTGMSGLQVFRRILFPQMMRFALPGIANNWQVLVKATALVSLIGLTDLVKVALDAGKSTFSMFNFILIAAVIYLALTSVSNLVLVWLGKRYSLGVREARI
ncbi:ABC transporter permease subunit [Cupriavidus basilensis]|uniref:ABC transporter permease subunit n=1 Tax=Cupriavidus basilensis TaxID=68895 RepID=A0ABT6AR02_9BURK|nr:ABC transporter permease subunit [Cupriavidus basilensis]MDF3835055.1 ABC transporter permease subunit [Cupriavidus basilensis]